VIGGEITYFREIILERERMGGVLGKSWGIEKKRAGY
jgi:hypothetical protein